MTQYQSVSINLSNSKFDESKLATKNFDKLKLVKKCYKTNSRNIKMFDW